VQQVSYSIILDSVFCLPRAVSVQGFVGPGLHGPMNIKKNGNEPLGFIK